MSQFGAFLLSELGDGFAVSFLGNLLVVDASPVDLHGWIEAFAFGTALVNSWVVIVWCTIAVSEFVGGLCALLDTINVTTSSLCNSLEGFFSVLPDLSPSLLVTNNCILKSVSNNFSLCIVELMIVDYSSIELWLNSTHAFFEGWAVTFCIFHAFLGLFTDLMFGQLVECIHLSLEDALLEFVGIACSIHSSESIPFCPEVYPWLNVFAVIDVMLSSCSSNYVVKINPVLLGWNFLSFLILLSKVISLFNSSLESLLIIGYWRKLEFSGLGESTEDCYGEG